MRDCGKCANCLRQAEFAELYVKFGYTGEKLSNMLRIDRWSMRCTEKESGDFRAQEEREMALQAKSVSREDLLILIGAVLCWMVFLYACGQAIKWIA